MPDYFGRLFTGWEGENTVRTRLKVHLDPVGSAALVIDGLGSCAAPTVSISASNTSNASVREDLTFSASVSGGSAPYTYAWDVDGDGVDDRNSSENRITTRYDRAMSIDVVCA
jgi:lysyl endopeptidase